MPKSRPPYVVDTHIATAGSAFDYSADDTFEPLTCSGVVPYSYASALNHVNEVPNIVREHAGVGKLSDPTDY